MLKLYKLSRDSMILIAKEIHDYGTENSDTPCICLAIGENSVENKAEMRKWQPSKDKRSESLCTHVSLWQSVEMSSSFYVLSDNSVTKHWILIKVYFF